MKSRSLNPAENLASHPLSLSESHRRHIAVSLRHAAELLEEADRILSISRGSSPFRKYTTDLAPWQAGVIADHIASIRRKLAEAGTEMGLDLSGGAIDARHAMRVQASFASIDIEELHSRYLRGYGALDPETMHRIDAHADALASALQELERALAVPPGESIEARIDRLARSPLSPEILHTLDQLITRYHAAELRRPMATLVERIEQRTFNVAVFGRVSSGKSSLLNALLGESILPVGLTPITAVPTRIRYGRTPGVRVVYGDKREETADVRRLAELASEELNPGNRRRVSLLQVHYPSPLLREGVEFVDTPGIGSLATKGSEETFAYLPRADLAILLIDAGSAVGPDELSVVRLLQSAAIPVQLVISKADLAEPPAIERMQSYVYDVIARETGAAPAIYAVSSVESGEPLLRRWIDESIQPLLEVHEEMLEASIRRTAGAIRDALIARLETLSKKRAPASTGAVEERARTTIFELRHWVEAIPAKIEKAVPDLLREAAGQLRAKRATEWDPRAVITAVVQRYLDDVRTEVVARGRDTKERLRELARDAGVAPDLLHLAGGADDLQQMPLLDVAAALPHLEVRPPLLADLAPDAATSRLAKRLQARFGASLRDTLRQYAFRLHDWAIHSIGRMQASFASALGAMGSSEDASELDLAAVENDLQQLASMTKEDS